MISSHRVRPSLVVALAALLCAPVAGAVTTPSTASPAPAGGHLTRVQLAPDQDQVAARPAAGYRPVRSATMRLRPRRAAHAWRVRGWRTNGFAQVGATWRGHDPRLQARSRSAGGRWGHWQELESIGDGPNRHSGEGRPGLHAADLWWAGQARDVQVRVRGTGYRSLKVVLIDPGAEPSDTRPVAAPAGNAAVSARYAKGKRPKKAPRPRIYHRKAWGANESWREKPRHNRILKQVHVHHTVSSNSYRRKDVPGMIRGMYRYHVFSLGWSDIGYNFLVDKFGRPWVGRAGGPNKRVRGAHTLGFNHNSTGIAAIGNFETTKARKSLRWGIIKLAAWKLDRYGYKPQTRPRVRSEGSDLYRYGARPRLQRIAGHRDTNQTACPGIHLYDRLPLIRRMAQRRTNHFS